jgi:hypothetical protein
VVAGAVAATPLIGVGEPWFAWKAAGVFAAHHGRVAPDSPPSPLTRAWVAPTIVTVAIRVMGVAMVAGLVGEPATAVAAWRRSA